MGLIEKAKRELSFSLGWGYAPLPDSVTIEVNYDCNFRCPSCQLWTKEFKIARLGGARNLPGSDFKKILGDLHALGVKSVHFGGGEPLVRKDFLDLVAHAKSLGLRTSTFSNGYLLNDALAERIIRSELDKFSISIDGPNAEIDDALRGQRGAFEHAVKGIQALMDAQRRLGASSPAISIHCTVSSGNFLHLPEMVDLAKSLSVRTLSVQYVSVVDKEIKDRTNAMVGDTVIEAHTFADLPPHMLLGPEHLDRFEEIMAKIAERAGTEVTCELDPAFVRGDKALLRQGVFPVTACQLPWRSAIISPIGDVLPCSMYTAYRMGNLQETPFETIWNGQRARAIRERLGDVVPPVCQRCCVVHESDPPLWKRLLSAAGRRIVGV